MESAKGSNVSSPLLAPQNTSATPYGGLTAPQKAAPVAQTPAPQKATRSAQEIQNDITSLEAQPPSRMNNAKLAQLKQELQKAGGTSIGTPTPLVNSSLLDKLYGRNAIFESLKKDFQKMEPYLVKGEGKDGHFNKIDNLSHDEKLKAYEIDQDIVDKSSELLRGARTQEEKEAFENYNTKAQLYAKELDPLHLPL